MSQTAELNELEESLAKDIGRYIWDPFGFVKYIYPWSRPALANSPGPHEWQGDVLRHIGGWLQSGVTRYQPCQIAVSSGHGVGKSALCAQLVHWAMSTCDDCKVVVTANTGDQLKTKTQPEATKWFRLAINAHWFDVQATSIAIKDPRHERTWRTDFETWNVARTEAFAGLHNAKKRILLIFDEASAIDDKIWEVAEGALTDEQTEIIWLAFGNPTQPHGRFRECWGKFAHRWKTFQVDARYVTGTNKEQIERWREDWGEDSDFFRVRVRGEFPRIGLNQFIAPEVVAACRKYKAEGYATFPKVLGVDVARFGDDRTVMFLRQGRRSEILGKYRGFDTAQTTAQTISFMEEHNVDATVVDSDGIGATVYDQLKFRGFGRRLFEFHGGHSANDANKYFNRRAEVWGLCRDWLNAGAEIPDDPDLELDLTGPIYGFSAQQQIQLEKKDDMKKRGVSSPDSGDALAMTFAVNVAPPKPPEPVKYVYPGQMGQSWMR
jgi:hypothetical protein